MPKENQLLKQLGFVLELITSNTKGVKTSYKKPSDSFPKFK